MNEKDLIVARDFRRAADDDPVLGPVQMLLQRKPATGLHHDALDLIARSFVDGLIIAPGPIAALMFQRLAAVLAAQEIDEFLHLVAMGAVEHKNGILRRNDDDIVHADDSRQMSSERI